MSHPPNVGPRPPRIVVVGSINLDLVVRVGQLPRPGETVRGRDLVQIPGGKGANQAVAAARLGAQCAMVGRVGDDAFGAALRTSLEEDGVETRHVRGVAGCSSGTALIGVEEGGQNAIMVVAGANARLGPEDMAEAEPAIASADAVLLQLEIPLEAVEAATRLARRHGVPVILTPAPVPETLPSGLLEVDILCPNETEAERLSGIRVIDNDTARLAARQLLRRGARRVVLTLGDRGALVCDERGTEHVPAFPVQVIDSTAAGDAFAAALAVALAEGRPVGEAARFACAAGALTVTRVGAQPSLPTRDEVLRLIAD